MKSSVEQLSETRVKITVEVPFSELGKETDEAYRSLAQQVTLPGFRKGKVPPKVLEARLGRGAVLDQVINSMLPTRYSQAVDENDLKTLGQPTVDITRLEDGEFIEFTAEVDVRPAIELPNFSELSVEVPAINISEDAVDAELDRLRTRFATLKDVDREAQNGDFTSIDLSATVNGESVDEAATEGLSYRVGQGELVDGLDEALVGMKVGESKEFTTKLVAGEHEGEEAQATVTLKSLKEQELPEADDDFAQLASEFDTIEELRGALSGSVEERARNEQAVQIRDAVMAKALEITEFPIPESVVTAQMEAQVNNLIGQFGGSEETFNEMLASQGTSREEFDKDSRTSAEESVRTQLFLDALADSLNQEVSQQEFTDHILFTASSYGMEPQQFLQALQASDQLGMLYADVRRGKALATVICDVTVTDDKGETVDAKEYFGSEEEEKSEESTEE